MEFPQREAATRRACRPPAGSSRAATPARPARSRADASPSANGSSVSIVARRSPEKPRPARIGSARAIVLHKPAGSWRGLARSDHPHSRGAIGESRGDHFQADLRYLVDGKRQDIGGQSVAVTGECVDQRTAMILVMEQQNRQQAARIAIDREQRAQLAHQRIGRRQRIAGAPVGHAAAHWPQPAQILSSIAT